MQRNRFASTPKKGKGKGKEKKRGKKASTHSGAVAETLKRRGAGLRTSSLRLCRQRRQDKANVDFTDPWLLFKYLCGGQLGGGETNQDTTGPA